jgi:hypothetical protein
MKTVIAIIMTNIDSGGTLRHAYEMAEESPRTRYCFCTNH